MQFLSEFEMFAVLVGALAPLAIGLLAQSGWSDARNALVGAAVVLFSALGTVYFYDPVGFSTRSIVTSIVMVFFTAVTVHSHLLKPLGLYDKLKHETSVDKA